MGPKDDTGESGANKGQHRSAEAPADGSSGKATEKPDRREALARIGRAAYSTPVIVALKVRPRRREGIGTPPPPPP